MRTLAIGDIHGCADELRNLLDFIDYEDSDELVFLGDYIDRGPNSKSVIDCCIEIQKRANAVFVKGNHEQILEDIKRYAGAGFSDQKSAAEEYFGLWTEKHGGAATLNSYGLPVEIDSLHRLPVTHQEFLASLKDYHETAAYIFTHAPPSPGVPMTDQTENGLRWAFDYPFMRHCSGKKIVHGHVQQRKNQPRVTDFGWGIDTGAGSGGWLTALELPSGKVFQVKENVRRELKV